MGRVVKQALGVVIAAGLVVAAPYMAGLALGALGVTSSIATAMLTAGILAAGSMAVRNLATARVVFGFGGQEIRPPVEEMPPRLVHPFFRVALWLHYGWQIFGRFSFMRVHGDCMSPLLPAGMQWALLDKRATIRRGDLFAFSISTWGAWSISTAATERRSSLKVPNLNPWRPTKRPSSGKCSTPRKGTANRWRTWNGPSACASSDRLPRYCRPG